MPLQSDKLRLLRRIPDIRFEEETRGYSKDQVINDLLEQYERHMHYLHQLRLSQSVGQ